ncbi:putative undecaprenyl-phosphate alpha-N-acetylglucosaminyl 1-phosphate transferase [gamma proteobacterium HdN1]|nr:putative undecaprenyl-phosphate alpha-N-acetylglucosaminyl 1-phosphate transferase [gamma proteobacterium HdN1]
MQAMTAQIALLLITPAVFTLIALRLLIPLARRIGLVDHPDQRKLHHGAPPLVGGLAIFVGYSITWAMYLNDSHSLLVFTLCATLVVGLGAFDDARGLSAKRRLIAQAMIALLICIEIGNNLSNLGDLFGFGAISLGTGIGSLIITNVAIVGGINAFNMVDGIDGLAGSLALVSLCALAILLLHSQDTNEFALSVTLAICVLPYLAANLVIKPFHLKIFMGDAGSTLLGFSIAWLLIQGSQGNQTSFRPVTALWLIAIPLVDMITVMLSRILKGKSPFSADRIHLHHLLLDAGFTQRQTLRRIVLLASILATIGLVGEALNAPESVMFGGFLIFMIPYIAGGRNSVVKHYFSKRLVSEPSCAVVSCCQPSTHPIQADE